MFYSDPKLLFDQRANHYFLCLFYIVLTFILDDHV